jgi:2-oxoglutarate ferredoxin oxidoreductase subunit delta
VELVTNATKKFEVEVNSIWCKGCSLCVGICPKKILELSDRQKAFAARENECIGCRQCENICPDLAITIKEASK